MCLICKLNKQKVAKLIKKENNLIKGMCQRYVIFHLSNLI